MPSGRVALFSTCIVDQVFPQVGIAMADVLERLGYAVDFPEAQTCCGQPAFNSGYRAEAANGRPPLSRRLPRRPSTIVVPSGSCTAMITHHFAESFPRRPRHARRSPRPRIPRLRILRIPHSKSPASTMSAPASIGMCHVSRQLPRPARNAISRKPPAPSARQVRGLTSARWTSAEECCGFGGTFCRQVPRSSPAPWRAPRSIPSVRTGADTVVSIDSSCLMQIQGALSPRRLRPSAPSISPKFSPAAEPLCRTTINPESAQPSATPRLQLAIYTATGRLMDKRKRRRRCRVPARLPGPAHARPTTSSATPSNISIIIWSRSNRHVARPRRQGRLLPRTPTKSPISFSDLAKERGARLLVKSKSMTTEEIHFNDRLEHHDLESVETDLGEYSSNSPTSAPITSSRPPCTRPATTSPTSSSPEPRRPARGGHREADHDRPRASYARSSSTPTSASPAPTFVVAESGAVVHRRERRQRPAHHLRPACPHRRRRHREGDSPRARDLAVFLNLLGRSATGQPLSVYTSFLAGPRRPGEIDGPDEFYLRAARQRPHATAAPIATSASRSSASAAEPASTTARSIAKSAVTIIPWIYSGPIGAIITPQFHGA